MLRFCSYLLCLSQIMQPSKLMTRVRFPSPAPTTVVELASRMRPLPIPARLASRNQVRSLALSGRAGEGEYDNALSMGEAAEWPALSLPDQ